MRDPTLSDPQNPVNGTDEQRSVAAWQAPLLDPLPLEVARAFGFPLDHIILSGGTYLYKLRHWLIGCVNEKYADMALRNLRRAKANKNRGFSGIKDVRPLEAFEKVCSDYTAYTQDEQSPSGRTVQEEYVTDELLYRLTQDIRATESRKSTPIDTIKDYLAKSGAFVDKARRGDEQAKLKLQQAITAYQLQGHSIDWSKFRANGIDAHKSLANTLKTTHNTHSDPDYGRIFGAQTTALFNKAKAVIVEELGLTPSQAANLRDHLGAFALNALGTASMTASARMKREAKPLTDAEQVEIVSVAARLIAPGMKAAAEFAGVDFLSGDPLDAAGHRVRITQNRMLNGGAK